MSIRIIILTTVNCLVWTLNSISFWQLGVKMPGYPIFANWMTFLPYILFIPLLAWKRVKLPRRVQLLLVGYTLLSIGDSVLEILADSNTGGVVQAICSTAIPIPFIVLLTWIVFKRRPTVFEMIGSAIVMAGSGLTIFADAAVGMYVNWWIVVYILGLVLGCIYTIIWEYIFINYPDTEVVHIMGWTTLYSLPLYFLTIFVYGANAWQNQSNGFECFVGHNPLPPDCSPNAWIPLVIYSLSSVASDIVQLYFVKSDSAFFLIIADTLTTPLSSIIMSSSALFGESAEPITWHTIVSCVLIVIGILVYKLGEPGWKRYLAYRQQKYIELSSSQNI